MKVLKTFRYFIENKIVKKQFPDKLRSEDLIKEAERKYNSLKVFLEKIGLEDENANDIVESCYDIIINLIRAKMLLKGLNSSGQGAHEAEISYLRELNFLELEVNFVNQLRYFRNGILYYGKRFDKEYAEKVLKFLEKVYSKLKKSLKE